LKSLPNSLCEREEKNSPFIKGGKGDFFIYEQQMSFEYFNHQQFWKYPLNLVYENIQLSFSSTRRVTEQQVG
jgi:hypothetical protein